MQSRRNVLIKLATAATSAATRPLWAERAHDENSHAHELIEQAPTAPTHEPAFFSQDEFSTVARLSDLIIPRTDTPGAVDAGVPHLIDWRISRNSELQNGFRQGLAELAERAKTMNAASFVALPEPQQVSLLESMSNSDFFKTLKDLTVDGYYSSEAGLVQELHFQGNTYRPSFPGCTHPEHRPSEESSK